MSSSADRVSADLSRRKNGGDDRFIQLKEDLAELKKEGENKLAAIVERLADKARDGEFDRMDEYDYFMANIQSVTSSILEATSWGVRTLGGRPLSRACHEGATAPPEQAGAPSDW